MFGPITAPQIDALSEPPRCWIVSLSVLDDDDIRLV
jgi:hypothetical protein